MKKIIIALLAMTPSLALSFGGVVTDPQSYTYYVKQLEQGIEQLEKVEEKIKIATDTYNKMVSLDENVSGNVQRAQGSLEKIKELQNISSKDLDKSLRYAKKALEEIEDIPEYQEEIEDGVADVFGVEAQEENGWVSVEAKKKRERQEAYRKALVNSELAQGKIALQYEKMEELAQATNSADSLKDSTDVTNTILLEMLDNQKEMITLLAGMTQSVSLAFYDGDTNEADKKAPVLSQPNSDKKAKPYPCGPLSRGCKMKSYEELNKEISGGKS